MTTCQGIAQGQTPHERGSRGPNKPGSGSANGCYAPPSARWHGELDAHVAQRNGPARAFTTAQLIDATVAHIALYDACVDRLSRLESYVPATRLYYPSMRDGLAMRTTHAKQERCYHEERALHYYALYTEYRRREGT